MGMSSKRIEMFAGNLFSLLKSRPTSPKRSCRYSPTSKETKPTLIKPSELEVSAQESDTLRERNMKIVFKWKYAT